MSKKMKNRVSGGFKGCQIGGMRDGGVVVEVVVMLAGRDVGIVVVVVVAAVA